MYENVNFFWYSAFIKKKIPAQKILPVCTYITVYIDKFIKKKKISFFIILHSSENWLTKVFLRLMEQKMYRKVNQQMVLEMVTKKVI